MTVAGLVDALVWLPFAGLWGTACAAWWLVREILVGCAGFAVMAALAAVVHVIATGDTDGIEAARWIAGAAGAALTAVLP